MPNPTTELKGTRNNITGKLILSLTEVEAGAVLLLLAGDQPEAVAAAVSRVLAVTRKDAP